MARSVRFLALFSALLIFGCGPDDDGGPAGTDTDGGGETMGPDGGGPVSNSCEGSETRCSGQVLQTCDDGEFVDTQTCSNACDAELGCVDCQPGGLTCSDNDVYTCNDDGTVGELAEDCGAAACMGGQCQTDCVAGGVDLIYVVDDDDNFLSFDPSKLGTGDPFTLIGQLDCNAADELPGGFGAPEGAPFSMSVDRNGVAWVLHSSGEIFHVSIDDASCQSTSFQTRQGQYDLFGMGFASDSAGSSSETLYIAGGAYDDRSPGRLGLVDDNLTVIDIGDISADSEFGPELTGTADGRLYGYFPDGSDPFIQEFDKTTGALIGSPYPMTGRGDSGGNMAWAFAHWGGDFYVFLTIGNDGQVYRVDPETGQETTVIEDLPYRVVGAGVSTCAPTSPE